MNVTSIYSFGSSGVCRNSLIPAISSRGSGFTVDILSSLLRPVRFSAGFGFCFQVFLSFLWTWSSFICSSDSFAVCITVSSAFLWYLLGLVCALVCSYAFCGYYLHLFVSVSFGFVGALWHWPRLPGALYFWMVSTVSQSPWSCSGVQLSLLWTFNFDKHLSSVYS